MKSLALLGLAALSLGLLAFSSARPDGIAPGTPAPEINSSEWFNHIGKPLTLADLKGQAVLIEFWATW
jgi:hypothetical protein